MIRKCFALITFQVTEANLQTQKCSKLWSSGAEIFPNLPHPICPPTQRGGDPQTPDSSLGPAARQGVCLCTERPAVASSGSLLPGVSPAQPRSPHRTAQEHSPPWAPQPKSREQESPELTDGALGSHGAQRASAGSLGARLPSSHPGTAMSLDDKASGSVTGHSACCWHASDSAWSQSLGGLCCQFSWGNRLPPE